MIKAILYLGLLGGSVVKNPHANAGGIGSVPGSDRAPEEGNGTPLQDSCLGNPTGFQQPTEDPGGLQPMGS